MSEASIRSGIFKWIKKVVPTVWSQTADIDDDDQPIRVSRPANTIAFRWFIQDAPRPAVPVILARLSNDVRIGKDSAGEIDTDDNNRSYSGDREEMLYLEFYGSGGKDILRSIRNATQDDTAAPSVRVDGFAVVECGPVVDASAFLDSMPEPRSNMDLRIRYSETWTTGDDTVSTIEHAEMSGEIDGADALPDQHVNPIPPEEPTP